MGRLHLSNNVYLLQLITISSVVVCVQLARRPTAINFHLLKEKHKIHTDGDGFNSFHSRPFRRCFYGLKSNEYRADCKAFLAKNRAHVENNT